MKAQAYVTIALLLALGACAQRQARQPTPYTPAADTAQADANESLRHRRNGITGPTTDPEFLRRVAMSYLDNGFPEGIAWITRASAADEDIALAQIDCRTAGKLADTQPMFDCMIGRRYFYASKRPPIPVPNLSNPVPDAALNDRTVTCKRTPLGAVRCTEQ